MKRILLIILTITLVLSVFSGCAEDEFVPPITVEYIVNKDTDVRKIMLDYESDLIMDLLNSGKWIKNDTVKVSNDYIMTISHKEILYCSETGTFTDKEARRYIIADEADRTLINESLQRSLNLSDNYLHITLTIAETLPSCVPFEYREPYNPYCLYAYDADGHLYRVLWTDWDGLNEKDRIVVEYPDIKELDQTNPHSGWNPKYEITAISVKPEHDR